MKRAAEILEPALAAEMLVAAADMEIGFQEFGLNHDDSGSGHRLSWSRQVWELFITVYFSVLIYLNYFVFYLFNNNYYVHPPYRIKNNYYVEKHTNHVY